jgi:hypothetical protein
VSDELSAALRELAADRATAPIVGGPATRARAMRRRRRRRAAATLAAGTAALALLGFALTLRLGEGPDRSAGPGSSAVPPPGSALPRTATPAPVSGALDLPGGELTFGGRVMPIVSKFDLSSGPTGTPSMRVVAKKSRVALTVDMLPKGYAVVNVASAVELRGGEGGPLYVGVVAPDVKAAGDYDAEGAVITLGAEDARWLYARIRLGDSIVVTAGAAPEATPSAADPAPGATASPSGEARVAPPSRASAPVGEHTD